MMNNEWQELTVPISDIERLISDGFDIEVDSPDGFVPVSAFVDKGQWKEYVLETKTGLIVRCNENHLFQTTDGWMSAKELVEKTFKVLNDQGEWVDATISEIDNYIPIVDIQVDHPNHRYYTNGISSHNTNVGKTLAMCSFTTDFLTAGKNVLYITLEMSEERISERIDANLLDISLETLRQVTKAQYVRMINNARKNISGRLFVKEYPTAASNVLHFRKLLTELELKKKFVPDIIVVDYLSICASSRIKGAGVSNTYVLVKSIAEELRGLGVEYNVPILTGAQVTRSGYADSDFDMTHIAESWGIATSADLMFSIVSTEELEKSSQFLIKQLKNRYNDKVANKKHIVGVDKSKMRIFDVSNDSSNYVEMPEILLEEPKNISSKFDDWF